MLSCLTLSDGCTDRKHTICLTKMASVIPVSKHVQEYHSIRAAKHPGGARGFQPQVPIAYHCFEQ